MAPRKRNEIVDDATLTVSSRRVKPRLELQVDYNPFAPPAIDYYEVEMGGNQERTQNRDPGPDQPGSTLSSGPAGLLRSVLLDKDHSQATGPPTSPSNSVYTPTQSLDISTHDTMSGSPPPDRISGYKRTRVPTDADVDEDEDFESSAHAAGYDIGVPVHQRACVRCKNLKVKCEVKSINEVVTEPCRRCKNAGYECVLPGTKKRKAPPKRSDLMQTIQEQSSQIRYLQEQLNVIRNGQSLAPPNTVYPNGTHKPHASSFSPPERTPAHAAEPEIRNWIISAISEQHSEEEDEFEETEDEDYGQSSNGNDLSQASSGDSRRSPPGPRSLRGITSTIPSEASPLGMMASLSIQASSGGSQRKGTRGSDSIEEEGVGLPEPAYFEKGPAADSLRGTTSSINQRLSPSIFTNKLISTHEAEVLFRLYYERINVSVFMLDPALYNAQQTCLRNTFLFTVVCAIASRYLPNRPGLYDQLMEHALIAAGVTLSTGAKSVEIVFAYTLLALYPRPARRWEDDRSWWYLGVATRVAMDLNIHHPPQGMPTDEKKAREALNRTRAWACVWIWDKLIGSFTGKDPLEVGIDAVALRGEDWSQISQWNLPGQDQMISGMVVLMKSLYKHRGKIYTDPGAHMGLNTKQDFRPLGIEADTDMSALQAAWIPHLREMSQQDVASQHRINLLDFYYTYSRLRYLNFCVSHVAEAQHKEDPTMLRRCHAAALSLVQFFQRDFAQHKLRPFVMAGPDCNALIITIACVVLVKLLRPPLVQFFSADEQQQMREEIRAVINVLSSPEIAVDQLHGPHHHARFLALVSEAPVLSPNSQKAVPLHPLSGGYVDAVGSGSYPAGVMSPNGALPMNSAFEPAMMDLYNNTVQTPTAGSWTYAPGSTAGVYSNHNHNTVPTQPHSSHPSGMVPAAAVAVDPREWYQQQQNEYYHSTYAYQDAGALRYPPAEAPAPLDMRGSGMQAQWMTSASHWSNQGYPAAPPQGHMYGYPPQQ